jgi:putative FmdB family regulatory protein
MPLYEFCCSKCSYEFEDLLPLNSENPTCPKCNSQTNKKISHVLGIVKGSTNRLMDCVIGAESEKKWKALEQRKKIRDAQRSK